MNSLPGNVRYLLLLCLALAGCLAFYAWQWWVLQPGGTVIQPPAEGSPEWYRQAYSDVVRHIDQGNLRQARERLGDLQAARGAPAGRLPAELLAAAPSDLHSNPMHAGGVGKVAVSARVPDYRPADAPLGPCQLRVAYFASEQNGGWQLRTEVIEPATFSPLSEEEAAQIRQQAQDRIRPDTRTGWSQWSNFVFTRVDCIRASDPLDGEGQ